jgi:hypothetical protein
MVRRALMGLAVAVSLLASGCARTGESQQPSDLSGRLDDGGVTVLAMLTVGPDGSGQVRATFSPQRPGFHVYSIDLPPGGVNGLGIPTIVSVHGGLRVTGDPTADMPVRNLRIEELDVDLPVYPDGPVTVTVPVRRTGNEQPEVVVTYGACSLTACLAPVRDRPITLT